MPWHTCGVRGRSGDSSFHHVSPGDQTQAVRLGSKHLLSPHASLLSFPDFFENLVQTKTPQFTRKELWFT